MNGVKRHPEPGDITVCIVCADILRYTRSMKLRLLGADEMGRLTSKQVADLRELQRAVQRARTLIPGVLHAIQAKT